MIVIVAGDWFPQAEQQPSEHGADDRAMDEVDGKTDAAEPEEGRVRESTLQHRGEHDAHCYELHADGGPIAELLDALREDFETDFA